MIQERHQTEDMAEDIVVEEEMVDGMNKGRRLTSRKITIAIINVTIARGIDM